VDEVAHGPTGAHVVEMEVRAVLRSACVWIVQQVVQRSNGSLRVEQELARDGFARLLRIRQEHGQRVPRGVRRVLVDPAAVVVHVRDLDLRGGHGVDEAALVSESATTGKVFPAQLEAVLGVGPVRVVQCNVLRGSLGD